MLSSFPLARTQSTHSAPVRVTQSNLPHSLTGVALAAAKKTPRAGSRTVLDRSCVRTAVCHTSSLIGSARTPATERARRLARRPLAAATPVRPQLDTVNTQDSHLRRDSTTHASTLPASEFRRPLAKISLHSRPHIARPTIIFSHLWR